MVWFLIVPVIALLFWLLSQVTIKAEFSVTLILQGIFFAIIIRPIFGFPKYTITIAFCEHEENSAGFYRIGAGKIKKIDKYKNKKRKPLSKRFSTIYTVFRLFKIEHIEIESKIGINDASRCVIACAATKIIAEELGKLVCDHIKVNVNPLFNTTAFRLDLAGIAQIKTAQIITSAIKQKMKKTRIKEGDKSVLSTSH